MTGRYFQDFYLGYIDTDPTCLTTILEIIQASFCLASRLTDRPFIWMSRIICKWLYSLSTNSWVATDEWDTNIISVQQKLSRKITPLHQMVKVPMIIVNRGRLITSTPSTNHSMVFGFARFANQPVNPIHLCETKSKLKA